MSSFQWTPLQSASGVTSLDGLSGALTLVAGSGITITDGASSITIASSSAGDVTLSAFGSSPNANGASLTGQALTLQPASASFPGGVSTTTQSFAGNKTFTGTIAASNLSGTNTGDVTIGTASGLSLVAQALSLGLASAGVTGALSGADWSTFNNKQAAGNYITALTGDVTAAGPGSVAATVAKIQGTTVSGTTGTANVVFSSAPTLTNPIVGTQAQGDGSTKAASTSYVDVAIANAIAGVNPAVAVQAATTAASDTSGYTYNNGVSGIGATLTGVANTALTVDGFTFTALGQRLLVKNDTQSPSGAFNGIYYVTQVQTGILPLVLTRALDYDAPSDMNNTGAIPVINGTANGTTSWVLTSSVVAVGTTPLTFTEFTRNPADYLLKANNLNDVANAATSFNNISPLTTLGDTLYASGANTSVRLAGNITSTKKFKTQTGTGSVSAAPAWSTIVGSDLPNPSSSTLGGVQSAAAVSHQWINSISTSGVPALSQPAFTDISGSVAASQMPALTGDVTTSAGAVATSLVATSNATLTSLSALTSASSLATVGTVTGGTWSATTIALNKGGTGQTTKAAAFDALQPMTTGGDIIYGGASGTGTRLANGSNNQVLTSAGGTSAPTWANVSGSSFSTQSANLVFAGPSSGSAATPTFRSLVRADIPTTVKLLVYDTSGTAYNNGPTDVTFNTSVTDSNSAFSVNKLFTVPTGEGGWYIIQAALNFTGVINNGQNITLNAITTGGTWQLDQLEYDNANSRSFTVKGMLAVQLSAADTVKLSVSTNTAGSQTLSGTARVNYLSITKISP